MTHRACAGDRGGGLVALNCATEHPLGRLRPQATGQVAHHAVELAAQQLVELFGAAVVGKGVVDEGVVDDEFVGELFGQAVQPLALHRRPGVFGVDCLHGLGHALFKGQQCLAQRGLADVGDDAGGNVLVAVLAPGGFEASASAANMKKAPFKRGPFSAR